MALNVQYKGTLPDFRVGPLSDGSYRTGIRNAIVSVPNVDAVSLMATPDWVAGDEEAAAYVPAAPASYDRVLVRSTDNALVRDNGTRDEVNYSAGSQLVAWAMDLSGLRYATVRSRSADGLPVDADVIWADGATGVLTATVDAAFGAYVSWAITHILNGRTTTYTQPTITLDATTGLPASGGTPSLLVT